jgi:group I intron endonuclease
MGADEIVNTGIYQIVNKINDERYIGGAVNITARKNLHYSSLRRGKHYSRYLQRAYNKHGEENFKFEVILYCDKENLIFYEQRAIDAYNDLYNIAPIAGNNIGVKHTAQSKENIEKSKRGKKRKPEHVKKTANSQRGQIRLKFARENNGTYVFTDNDWIKKLHSEGKTNKEISMVTGYTMRTIQTRMKWFDIDSNRGNKLKKIDIKELHRLKEKGLFYYEIAKIMNVSISVINRNYMKSKHYKGKPYGKRT